MHFIQDYALFSEGSEKGFWVGQQSLRARQIAVEKLTTL